MPDDDAPYSVALNKDGPRDPRYLLEVAQALPEAVRVANHLTRHHEAIEKPHQAHELFGYLELTASRLPQLIDQVARWVGVEAAAGRLRVTAGDWEGVPEVAIAAVRLRADRARGLAEDLTEALASLGEATKDLAGPEDGDGSDD
jgi:hypothetical protein